VAAAGFATAEAQFGFRGGEFANIPARRTTVTLLALGTLVPIALLFL